MKTVGKFIVTISAVAVSVLLFTSCTTQTIQPTQAAQSPQPSTVLQTTSAPQSTTAPQPADTPQPTGVLQIAKTPEEAANRFLTMMFTVSNYDFYNAIQSIPLPTMGAGATPGITSVDETEFVRIYNNMFENIATDKMINSLIANSSYYTLDAYAAERGSLISVESIELDKTSSDNTLTAFVYTVHLKITDTKTKAVSETEKSGMMNVSADNGGFKVSDFSIERNLTDPNDLPIK